MMTFYVYQSASMTFYAVCHGSIFTARRNTCIAGTVLATDETSAEKFHYIKTLSGKVVAQSIAFRVVSIHWQEDDPFALKSWLQVTYPLLKAASFDTFCLVAPQPQETEKDVQLHLTRTRHGLSNEP